MYVNPNFRTKKELKEAIAAGRDVEVYDNSMFSVVVPENGTVYLEGPHFPEPHKWYAQGTMQGGRLVKIK